MERTADNALSQSGGWDVSGFRGRYELTEGAYTGNEMYAVGQGNWRAVHHANFPIDHALEAAEDWGKIALDHDRLWLVWCVHPDWALLQQRLVQAVGWTPVVGNDPRVKDVPLTSGAIRIDFNAKLNLPVMYPHFPLELSFLWARKLAFWHSDLLVRPEKLKRISQLFMDLKDGECAVTQGNRALRTRINPRRKRYWELIGCTTQGASRSQWDYGAGWWMNFYMHPNCPDTEERFHRKKYYYDHGTGIRYWAKKNRSNVITIPVSYVEEGHFTKIGNPDYISEYPHDTADNMRNMQAEISSNFDLSGAAASLGIDKFLK